MQIINKLLEWNFRPSHLKYTAEHLFTQSTKKQIDDSKETLEKIIDKLPDGSEMPSRKSIEDVYYLFLNYKLRMNNNPYPYSSSHNIYICFLANYL